MDDDFTYVSRWQGLVYSAFVIDTFADCILGWRVSGLVKTDFVFDASRVTGQVIAVACGFDALAVGLPALGGHQPA